MKRVYCYVLFLLFSVHLLFSSEKSLLHSNISATEITVLSSTLSRADVAFAKSVITPNAFRGDVGEVFAGKAFLKDVLQQTGKWQSITPRSGPQGFDHLFVKTDLNGNPTGLIVGESKFNTSRLGQTRDGIQMGQKWIGKRLTALGSRYISIANETTIFTNREMPLNPNRSVSVSLKSGKYRHFWKNKSTDSWNFSGTSSELKEAQRIAKNYGVYIQKAGEGRISYRSRIFNIIPKGSDLNIAIYDAKNINGKINIQELPLLSKLELKNVLDTRGCLPNNAKDEIAKKLQAKLNVSTNEAKKLADDMQKYYTPNQIIEQKSLIAETMKTSAIAASIATGVDFAIQLITEEQIDYKRLALIGGSTFIGVSTAQAIQILLTTPYMSNAIYNISAPLNCSNSLLTSSISSSVGGVVTTALISYGMYFCGYLDLKSANRSMIVGTSSVMLSSLAAYGTMSLIAAYGTASTGTAIATLSGAAATNASLALLGGGSVAAGGGGVFWGSVVMSGGFAIVAIAVGYTGYKICKLKDHYNEINRIKYVLGEFQNKDNFDTIINNSPYIKSFNTK